MGQFQGKQVRLRAAVHTADTEGQGRLYLYVAGPVGQNDPVGDPVTSQSWTTLERTVSVPSSASRLWIGVSVRAPGTAWFDNVELLVRNAPGDSWEHSRLANSGFESEERGGSLPGWRFSKDPGIQESTVAGNAYEGQRSLKLSVPSPSELRLFEAHPSMGEVAQKQIGRGISARIPLALHSRDGQTLRPNGAPPPGDLQARLDSLEIPRSDPDFFLANVVVAWNVFQHFYPYFNVVDVNWNRVLTQSLRRALADRSETEFQRTLQRMVARLQDGHGRVTPSPTSPSNWPLRLTRAGEIVIVGDVFSPAAADGNICPEPGDVVISVGGTPIKTKLREAKRYISGSPQYTDVQALDDFGRLTDQPFASLILRRNGHRVECKVRRRSGIPPMQAEPRPDPIATLEGGIRYVDLTRVPWERVHKNIEAVAQAPGVIFDVRGYPQTGNLQVVSHLSRDTLRAPPFQTPQIIYPDQDSLVGYDTCRSTRSPFAPALPYIDGPVVFLTDAAVAYEPRCRQYRDVRKRFPGRPHDVLRSIL